MRKTLKQWRMSLSIIHKTNPMGIPLLFVCGLAIGYSLYFYYLSCYSGLAPLGLVVCIALMGIFYVKVVTTDDAHDQLLSCCVYGDVERVKSLISVGLKVSKGDYQAFKVAVRNRHLQVANVLRKAADKDFKCHKCIVRSTCLELCDYFKE
jgi:hypothetical protein